MLLEMKTTYVFDHDAYHNTLRYLTNERPRFYVVQRGGGLGGICRKIVKFIIPIIKSTVVPHMKKLASNVAEDVITNKMDVKQAILKQAAQLASNIRSGPKPKGLSGQKGAGITRNVAKRKLTPLTSTKVVRKKSKKKSQVKKTKFDFLT